MVDIIVTILIVLIIVIMIGIPWALGIYEAENYHEGVNEDESETSSTDRSHDK